MRGITLLLIILSTLGVACNDAPDGDITSPLTDGDKLKDSLSTIIKDLRGSLDSLQGQTKEDETDDWFIADLHAKELIRKGIEDPASYLRSELEKRPDLIPIKSVLGGKMAFRNIEILGSKWIIAEYDDGHIMGRSIYKYEWTEKDGVRFRVLDSVSW